MPLPTGSLRKIGARIRQARKEKGYSQEKLAELCAISDTYLGRLERGEKQPSLDTLVRLTECLGVSLTDVLIDLDNVQDRQRLKARIKALLDLL